MTEQNNPIWLLETSTGESGPTQPIAIDVRTIATIDQPFFHGVFGATITLQSGAVYKVEASYQDVLDQWRAAVRKPRTH